MSSGGQIVGGIVGAVVGYVVTGFNPYGAFQGFAIGASIGLALDPPKGPTVSGPRLADLAVQTSTYGSFIPRIYGTVPLHGNILWLENGRLKETVRKKSQGGKGAGGGGSTVKTYSYSATFAVGLCEGPIAGVRRIWCLDKLIYNAGSDDLETIMASNKAAQGWNLYLGTEDQEPDSRYEADVGVGNAPAYRGMAYIVFYDFKLEDYNNSLQSAQFKFEVVQDSTLNAPSLVSSYELQDDQILYTDLYQTSGMYADQDSGLRLFRAFNSTSCQKWISGTTSFRAAGEPFAFPDEEYVLGTSDKERIVTVVSGGFIVYDGFGVEVTSWLIASPGVAWSRWRMHINGEREYAVSNEVAQTRIYYKDEGSTLDPLLVSTTTSSSLRGQIFDICIDSSSIYAISKTKQLTCYDFNFVEQWNIDLSSEAFSLDLFSGAVSVIRVSSSGTILLRYNAKFWRINSSGYEYIGEALGFTVSSPGNASDQLTENLWIHYGNSAKTIYYINLDVQTNNLAPLDYIIEQEANLSSLVSSLDFDTSLIVDSVRGYRTQGGSIRSSLEPLQAIWPFDVRSHGYQLQCLPRGQSSVATISYEELGSGDSSESGGLMNQSREMDSQLPASTHIKYWDASREYANSEQYADRPGTDAVNRVDREFPIVLTATEAAKAADVLQQLPWLERTFFDFTLPPTYWQLEPGDVITINTPGNIYSLRLTEISDSANGVRQCKARPNNPTLYISNAVGGDGVIPPDTISLSGPSLFVPMDIPLVDEVSQNAPGFASAMTGYNEGWPGAIAVRSNDNGQTFTDIQAYSGKGAIAAAITTLGSHSGYLIQQASLTIGVISGDFESITQDQLLAGYNYAAYGVNGRWEIVRFQNATLNLDSTITLDTFVRGDKGTEWATGLHQVGDYFVLLDDADNAFIGMALQSIGVESTYRGVTAGSSVDEADDILFTYNAVNLETLSPVSAQAFRDGSSNLSATFYRRSRLGNTWWNTGVQSPIGETTESYEIDVMNGSTVVRTISVTSPAFSYSAADQTTDFGSPQSSILFRIYQLSEVVGRGYVYEVTL